MTTEGSLLRTSSSTDAPRTGSMRRIGRLTLASALILGAVALLLPPHATAAALVRDQSLLPDVTVGIWIFKLLLLVHSVFIVGLGQLPVPRSQRPLVARGVNTAAPASARDLVLLLSLLVLATALRLFRLGEGLWFDEIQTLVSYARLPVGQIVSTFDSQNQHMLYSLLAHGSLSTFGESAWALRLPAALFGVASLAALYWFARQLVGRFEALGAVAVLTVSYHHVWFSQNARGYTSLLFWTLIGSGLFLRILADATPRGWHNAVGYAVTMALAAYTHITALFIVFAHGLIWLALFVRSRESMNSAAFWLPAVAFLMAGTLTIQLYAVVLPQFTRTITEPTMEGMATDWKNPLWFVSETLRVLALGVPGGLITVFVAFVVFVTGIVSFARSSPAVTAVLLLPAALTAAVLLTLEHNLWPRFFFFSAGFGVLIAVRGLIVAANAIVRGRSPALAMIAVCLMILGSATTVPAAWRPKQDYEGALGFVARHRAPGDAVVTVDMSHYVYEKYAAPELPGVNSENELEAIEQTHHRTWVLYTFPTRLQVVQPAIWARLQQRYRLAAEFAGTVGGGAVVVKVKP